MRKKAGSFSGEAREEYEKGHNGNLEEVVHLLQVAGWSTPKESLGDKGVRSMKGGLIEVARNKGPDLAAQAAAAGWATPTVAYASTPTVGRLEKLAGQEDTTRNMATGGEPQNLHERVLTHLGVDTAGLTAQTVRDGGYPLLNKEFCRWLQGYPERWSRSAPTATP